MKNVKRLVLSVILMVVLSTNIVYGALNVDEYRNSVYKIRYNDGTGTAFYIGDGLFVTSAHLVRYTTDLSGDYLLNLISEPVDGTEYNYDAKIVYVSQSHDLAIVRGTPELCNNSKPLELKYGATLNSGDELNTVGYPKGNDISAVSSKYIKVATAYVVSNIDGIMRERSEAIYTDTPLEGGRSGAPLMDSTGGVVGVIMSGSSKETHSESIDHLKEVLEDLKLK